MPLSEYEQRVLEQMEQALTSDDPRLANTLQSPPRAHSALRYVAAGVAVVGGLLLLVLGVALPNIVLGILGFVLMLGGVVIALQSPKHRVKTQVKKTDGAGPARPAPPKSARGQGFLNRMEERWDRRRENGGER